MHYRARTDLCGGRLATVVPTANLNKRALSDVLGSVRIRPISDALVVSTVQVNVVRRNHHQPIDLGRSGRLRARVAASAEFLCNSFI